MAWTAIHRFARISPTKVRLIADMIRGQRVQEALNILKFTPNRSAPMLTSVLTSAIANANEAEASLDRLFINEVQINGGPTMKRFRPKDRGRAHQILKRTSHIFVSVEEK